MQACVEVWESDPAAYHYNPVGYIALGAAVQESDLAATYERQERIGYRSELISGEAEVDAHMKALFPDWRAQGVTICLHEHQGGFAFNVESVLGLRDKCLAEGVSVLEGVEVTGLRVTRRRLGLRGRDERRRDRGRRAGRDRARARGPRGSGRCSACPTRSTSRRRPGDVVRDRPMWTYWNLQEGEITVDPLMFATADGGAPPVIHLDTDAPLYTDDGAPRDGRAVGDLLQARPPRRAGRRLAARRRRRRRARPVPGDDGRRRELPGHVVRRALALDEPLRGLPRRSTSRRAPAASARSPRTTSRSSTTCDRTSTGSSTRTTATR